MDLKSRIGTHSSRFEERVTSARLEDFRSAVGARGDGNTAPPTYLTRCRAGEFELFQKLGIPLSRVLHAEQEYIYGEPIRAGDQLSYETRLGQAIEKRGGNGALNFLTFETDVRVSRGDERVSAGTCRTTIVVKGEI